MSDIPKIAHGIKQQAVGANSSNHISIDFTSAGFTSVPTITATANLGANSWSALHIENVSTTGATIFLYNSGTACTAQINWMAMGD